MLRAISIAVGLMLVQPARAESAPPSVRCAVLDSHSLLVTAHGRDFPDFPPATLTLNGRREPLAIVTSARTQITARLPEALPGGSYTLRVVDPASPERTAEVDCVVGAVGPLLDERH